MTQSSAKKKKTMSYVRACWPGVDSIGIDFQTALSTSLKSLPNVLDTRLNIGEGRDAEVRHRDSTGNVVCIHVASFTSNENMATVPHAEISQQEADLASEPSGDDWDYLDGDAMLVVKGNNCIIMPSGLREGTLTKYIRDLLGLKEEKSIRLPENIEKFQFFPIVDHDEVDRIRKQGIKTIDLNLGRYLTTENEYADLQKETIFQKISRDILESLISKEADRKKIQEAENVNASLSIKLDSRRNGLTPIQLKDMIGDVTDQYTDDVEFVTGEGQRVKRGKLCLRKQIDVKSFAKTVSYEDAWRVMKKYLDELSSNGFLEL